MKKEEAQKNVYGQNVPQEEANQPDGIREDLSKPKKRPADERGKAPASKTGKE